jgi:hypothetical protein
MPIGVVSDLQCHNLGPNYYSYRRSDIQTRSDKVELANPSNLLYAQYYCRFFFLAVHREPEKNFLHPGSFFSAELHENDCKYTGPARLRSPHDPLVRPLVFSYSKAGQLMNWEAPKIGEASRAENKR